MPEPSSSRARRDDNSPDNVKVPPVDLDAEQNLLGAIMLDGTVLAKITEAMGPLNADDFSSDKNRLIFSTIMHRANTDDRFDPAIICDILETDGNLERAGGRQYVVGLTDMTVPVSTSVELARIIRNKARRRRLIDTAESIIETCYAPEGRSVDEIYDHAQGLIFKLSEDNAHTDSGPQEAVSIALNLLEKIRTEAGLNRMTGTPTGFTELDDLTSGLQPGSLNIVAARPGIGKTSFAMNMVENIAMNPEINRPALVFSLEMPAQQIIMRMLCTFGRVSMKDLSEGRVESAQWHDMISKISLLVGQKADGNKFNKLYIDDSGDITPLELRSRARKLAAEFGGLSVIMVDYIQLMKGQTRYENRSLEVGDISRSLKMLAKELNIPVIALSQLNREVEGRRDHRPMNSDLRESGSLEQDADMIMFLHRSSVYKTAEEGEGDDGKALLIIGKNRNGATRDIELQFQGAYTAFYDKANLMYDDNNSGMNEAALMPAVQNFQ